MVSDLFVLTLNEVDGLKKIMPRVKKEWVNRIIVIDGGSTDGTVEEAKKMGLEVLPQKGKGHGNALLTGVNASAADHFIMWAPDGNFEPEEIPKLVKKAEEGFDQVIVSRFAKTSVNEDAGYFDTFGNKMFTFLTNVLFGSHLTDSLNGSRIISRKAMSEINFHDEGTTFADCIQITVRSIKRGHTICNIDGNERTRIGGVRKMNPFPVGRTLSLEIIKNFIFWKQ